MNLSKNEQLLLGIFFILGLFLLFIPMATRGTAPPHNILSTYFYFTWPIFLPIVFAPFLLMLESIFFTPPYSGKQKIGFIIQFVVFIILCLLSLFLLLFAVVKVEYYWGAYILIALKIVCGFWAFVKIGLSFQK